MTKTYTFDAVERAKLFNSATPKLWRAGAYARHRKSGTLDSIAYVRAGSLRQLSIGFRLFLPTMGLTVDVKASGPAHYYLVCQSIQRAAWELFSAFEETDTFPDSRYFSSVSVANRWEEQAIITQRSNGFTHVMPYPTIILHEDEENSDLGIDDLI